jgi:aryl-alcohol dehydrogenase-like predicted oxidoreductase
MKTSPNTEIPLRILGHTGEKISAIGLGGFHIGARMTEDEIITKAPVKSEWVKR